VTDQTDARLVSVRELEGPADEAFVRAVLDEAGFDYQIVTHQDDAFGTLVAQRRGYGSVLVPEEDAEEARELIRETLSAEPVPDEPA